MGRTVIFFLYNILSILSLLLYLPLLFFKKGPDTRGAFVRERLGISDYSDTDFWIHSVSVGEVNAAIPLLRAIRREYPKKRILLSTITYTGQHLAREKFPEADRIMYMPWDAGFIVKRVLKSLRPQVFITIETELWPNLLMALRERESRVFLMNGRISASSFRGYALVRFFFKKVFASFERLCMQDETSAERIISLGAPSRKVTVTGNFKFDMNLSNQLPAWSQSLKGTVITAGSTHRGEEAILLRAYREIRDAFHDITLVLAPRHPERFSEVEELLGKEGISFVRRSAMVKKGVSSLNNQIDVVLLDTIGELPGVYARSAITFIGGSLDPGGGQNILEAAYWSRPILMGPHTDNFPITSEFIERGAAFVVKDSAEILKAVTDLLNHREKAREMGRRAREIAEMNVGSVQRAMRILKEALS